MRTKKQPVEEKLGLMNLSTGDKITGDQITGDQITVDAIQSFSFSPDGKYLAMRHYPPQAANASEGAAPAGGGGRGGRGGGGNGADENTPGATLIVRELASNRDTTFGNISEYAWENRKKTGRLLAMAVSTPDKTGNGIELFDPKSGSLKALDSSNSIYSNFVWRKDSSDLAALKSKSDDKHDGSTYLVLAWKGLDGGSVSMKQYDPTADSKFPDKLRTVAFRRPQWSENGNSVYVGVAAWYPKPPGAKGGGEVDAAATTPTPKKKKKTRKWKWRRSLPWMYGTGATSR